MQNTIMGVVTGTIVVMVTMTLSDVRARCPARCFCQSSTSTVYCSRRGLDAIPDTIPPGTRQLYLNGNHFTSSVVRRANFSRFPDIIQIKFWLSTSSDRLAELEHLYMSDCAISTLEAGAFADLDLLRWLDLSDNRLTTLSDAAFAGSRLHQLFLNGNRHLSLDAGQPFANVTISGLYLHDCQLANIDASTLTPLMGSLRVLWLSENRLSMLDVSLGGLFASLDHFRLAGNPLRCTCELSWLWKIFEDRARRGTGEQQLTTEVFECQSPPSLRGWKFADLTDEDMRCRAPSLSDVEVTLPDRDDAAQSGRPRLILRCSATGDPTPDVYWDVASGRLPLSTIQKTIMDDVGEAVLTLDDDDDVHSTAAFQCVATNVVGSVTLAVRRISGTLQVGAESSSVQVQPMYTYDHAGSPGTDTRHRNTSSSNWPATSSDAICVTDLLQSGMACAGGRDRRLGASVDRDVRQSSSLSQHHQQYSPGDLMAAIVATVMLTAATVVMAAATCLRRRGHSTAISTTVVPKHLSLAGEVTSHRASATVVYDTTVNLISSL